MTVRLLPLFALGTTLCACSASDAAQDPPPVTTNEQQALSEAAEMLDERRTPQASPSPEETPNQQRQD